MAVLPIDTTVGDTATRIAGSINFRTPTMRNAAVSVEVKSGTVQIVGPAGTWDANRGTFTVGAAFTETIDPSNLYAICASGQTAKVTGWASGDVY